MRSSPGFSQNMPRQFGMLAAGRDNEVDSMTIDFKTCPRCKAQVTTLITRCKTNERFCHPCATDEEKLNPAVTVARKMHEHMMAGTLDQYTMSERLKDLREEWVQ